MARYAPFCKHIFMRNFTQTLVGDIPITPENEHLLRSGYAARREEELPVLERWFPKDAIQPPVAAYLDIILYSREQVLQENAAMGTPFTMGSYLGLCHRDTLTLAHSHTLAHSLAHHRNDR